MSDRIVCPACQVTLLAQAVAPWGDGIQRLPIAPWICSSCAALGFLDLASGAITLTPEDAWAVVQARNPTLWRTIERVRARIRGETP